MHTMQGAGILIGHTNSMYTHVVQRLAFLYAAAFFVIASLAYLPGMVDAAGLTLGLFRLDLHDDILHALSGLWALVAGIVSARQAEFFFRAFGSVYFLDAIIGLVTGKNVLNFHIFTDAPAFTGLTLIGVNAPHFIIGGSALLIGFVLVRYLKG